MQAIDEHVHVTSDGQVSDRPHLLSIQGRSFSLCS